MTRNDGPWLASIGAPVTREELLAIKDRVFSAYGAESCGHPDCCPNPETPRVIRTALKNVGAALLNYVSLCEIEPSTVEVPDVASTFWLAELVLREWEEFRADYRRRAEATP